MKPAHPNATIDDLFNHPERFLPSVSVKCVIFSFQGDELLILLVKFGSISKWALPGGLIYNDEAIDDAVKRTLHENTQLRDLFFQPFDAFGKVDKQGSQSLQAYPEGNIAEWMTKRFITIGYYALVEFQRLVPMTNDPSLEYAWYRLSEVPDLVANHKQIIEKALQTLRYHIHYQPICYNLLPAKFPLRDLQVIYEAILGKHFDRANFQRTMLATNTLERQDKHFSGKSHRAPFLYSFRKNEYFTALKEATSRVR
jgi:8-oxo-dGTP diphosphatase